MIPFQIADRFLCRLCIFGDNIAHTPTERCLHCRKEALRNTYEIGDGSRHVASPRLLGTEDDLYVLAKSLIALLHTPKKLQTLLCTEHLTLSLSDLLFIIFLCAAQFFHLFLDAAAFFFHPAQLFFNMASFILCCCKLRLCLCQKRLSSGKLLLCRCRMVAVLMHPRYSSKFFTQACQHTLYGVPCMRITLLFLFLCMHESLHAFKFSTCLMQRMFFSGIFLSFPHEQSINLSNFLQGRLNLNFGRLALLLNICFSFLPFIPAPFQKSSFSS